MSLTTLKLDISVNKITIKIMGKQDLLQNKVFSIQRNNKTLELQINKKSLAKKYSKEL